MFITLFKYKPDSSKQLLYILFFIVSIFSPTTYGEPNSVLYHFSDLRIVGGEPVIIPHLADSSGQITDIAQWPWVVALTSNGEQFCGASLIAPQWLLTAAHCVYSPLLEDINPFLQINAVFLQSDLSKRNSNSVQRNISQIIIHPDYDYSQDINDIALLKLDTPVNNIEPVLLPGTAYDSFTVSAGTMATVLGWGITHDNNDSEKILRKVELPVTEQATCSNSMKNHGITIKDNMLCAGYPEGGKDSCSGDSGGPLSYYSKELNNWVQIGVVSFGIGCAMPDKYGVYTRIAKYTAPDQLINTTICKELPDTPKVQLSKLQSEFTIKISTLQNDKDFRLYYTPYPQLTPIKYIDLKGNDFKLASIDKTYLFAVQTRKQNCVSHFSEMHLINL